MKLRGYEKAWAPIFGAGMAAAVTTLALYGASVATHGYIPVPSPEVVAAAIAAVVATFFAAAATFNATTSAPTAENPNSNQIGVPQPLVPDATPVVPTPTPTEITP